jgi:hypothetical protein
MKFLFTVPSRVAFQRQCRRKRPHSKPAGPTLAGSRLQTSTPRLKVSRNEENMTRQKARAGREFLQAIKKGGASLKIRLGPHSPPGKQVAAPSQVYVGDEPAFKF